MTAPPGDGLSAIAYANGQHELPGMLPGALSDQRRGYAYELDGFFVHVYGRNDLLWQVSPGLAVTERADGDLSDWVRSRFAAEGIETMRHAPGTVTDGVWRPGLTLPDHVTDALEVTRTEQRIAEQSLHLLIDALNELFLSVAPEGAGIEAYGPRMRELLILACTEVEDGWQQYLRRAGVQPRGQGHSTNDYVRLKDPLRLGEYAVALVPYRDLKARPFADWDPDQPTRSLPWYDAYNKTKHDRSTNLRSATLMRCIEAVAAAVVMFCVRYGPGPLYSESTPLASVVNHLFAIELADVDPKSLYVPRAELPAGLRSELMPVDMVQFTAPWTRIPLAV